MSINPDIQAHYRAQADRKRLMQLAKAWHRKGRGPTTFVASLKRMWPTGVARLGVNVCESAWHSAAGGSAWKKTTSKAP